jgi:hypothetical protein
MARQAIGSPPEPGEGGGAHDLQAAAFGCDFSRKRRRRKRPSGLWWSFGDDSREEDDGCC